MTRPESFNSVQKRSEFVQLLEETLTTAPLSLFSLPPDLCPVLFNLSTHTHKQAYYYSFASSPASSLLMRFFPLYWDMCVRESMSPVLSRMNLWNCWFKTKHKKKNETIERKYREREMYERQVYRRH